MKIKVYGFSEKKVIQERVNPIVKRTAKYTVSYFFPSTQLI